MNREWLDDLLMSWLFFKDIEKRAQDRRRMLEDSMIDRLDIALTGEGVQTFDTENYEIKVTSRITRSIDVDLLSDIAAFEGLTEHLDALVRWKPELNISAWKKASNKITDPLSKAITAKAGRPSFAITVKESEKK